MIAQGIKRAKSIQNLISQMDRFIAAILIGNNFVNIAMSALITAIFVQVFGYKLGVIVATFTTTIFILIICEITPKIMATRRAERIALISAPIMEFFVKFFKPIIPFFTGVSGLILKILGVGAGKKHPLITEEELRFMIELAWEEGFLSAEEKKMLHRIFEFGDTKVKDVMVPMGNIVSVDSSTPSEQLLDIFSEQSHARLPVYQGKKNNIVGVLYAKDMHYLIRDKELFLLQDLLYEPNFINQDVKVNEVLKKFQNDKIQIAIVHDENKNAVGLVTLEDLIEEIVGEIEQERPVRRKNNSKL